jgi:hypothetical protein
VSDDKQVPISRVVVSLCAALLTGVKTPDDVPGRRFDGRIDQPKFWQ